MQSFELSSHSLGQVGMSAGAIALVESVLCMIGSVAGGHIHVIVKQWKLCGQGSDLIRKGKSLEPSGWYQLIFC